MLYKIGSLLCHKKKPKTKDAMQAASIHTLIARWGGCLPAAFCFCCASASVAWYAQKHLCEWPQLRLAADICNQPIDSQHVNRVLLACCWSALHPIHNAASNTFAAKALVYTASRAQRCEQLQLGLHCYASYTVGLQGRIQGLN